MDKKVRIYIFIVFMSSFFRCAVGMNQDLVVSQLVRKEIISPLLINDYIIPVSNFSQALKKEALFTHACLKKMKCMLYERIRTINDYSRRFAKKEGVPVYTVDVSRERNQMSSTLRNFCSQYIEIMYDRSLYDFNIIAIHMKAQTIKHCVSPLGLPYEASPAIDIVVHNIDTLLKNKLEHLLKKGESFSIEFFSENNLSDWVKVTNSFRLVKRVNSVRKRPLLLKNNVLWVEDSSLFHARDLDYNPFDIQGIKIVGYSLFTGVILFTAVLINGLMHNV